jgi:PAS domain S-box-containing protein
MFQFLNRWFLGDGIPLDLCIDYHHDKWLVALSYVVAAFASYTAFHLMERVRSAGNHRIRNLWLAIAGTSMGCGIFAMHFIANLSVRIPILVQYDTLLTALSALFAVAASGIAFYFACRDERSLSGLLIGGVIMGAGIGLMHYTGMLALRMPAHVYYDPWLFSLSVLVAVSFSFGALLVLRISSGWKQLSRAQTRLLGALVMGLAVTLMHYTGMFATYFYPESDIPLAGAAFDGTLMAVAVGTATFLISSIAITGALLDRRAEVAEARRLQSESFLQTLIDTSADGILTFDEALIVETCNPAGARIFGRDAAAIIGSRIDALILQDMTRAIAELNTLHRSEVPAPDLDREGRAIEYTVNDMRFGGRRVFNCVVRDVTERRRSEQEKSLLETKLRQAQKLESLGTLAGGMAHEFNNMLVPISGLTELALRDVAPDTRVYRNLTAVLTNSRRAAQLVQQILSFARQEDHGDKPIELPAVVEEAVELLRATTAASISVRAEIDPGVGQIVAGETQIHQVLMNLASNARHALEGKVGEIVISLSRADFSRPWEGRFASLPPGSYAKLSVRDTGHGMDLTTLGRIFEPFFTTKNVGKGTGLGLAVIHGIVTSHGGAIEVESAPGLGTTFDIYWPRYAEVAPARSAA